MSQERADTRDAQTANSDDPEPDRPDPDPQDADTTGDVAEQDDREGATNDARQ